MDSLCPKLVADLLKNSVMASLENVLVKGKAVASVVTWVVGKMGLDDAHKVSRAAWLLARCIDAPQKNPKCLKPVNKKLMAKCEMRSTSGEPRKRPFSTSGEEQAQLSSRLTPKGDGAAELQGCLRAQPARLLRCGRGPGGEKLGS